MGANKPYSITNAAQQSADIDKMFKELYQLVATLQSGASTPAKDATRVLVRT